MAALFWAGRLTLVWALLIGALTAFAAAAVGYRLLSPPWRVALRRLDQSVRAEGRRLLTFSRWMWLSSVFSILSVQVDLLLLNFFVPLPVVGLYALARNLSQKADILNQTLHTVLAPTVSALEGAVAFRRFIRHSLGRSLLLALLLLLFLPLASPLIPLVYGQEFAAAVPVFYALTVLVIVDLFLSPLLLLALPQDQPRLLAVGDGVQVVLLLVIGALAIPLFGVYGLVLARLCARVAGAAVTLWPLLQRARQEER